MFMLRKKGRRRRRRRQTMLEVVCVATMNICGDEVVVNLLLGNLGVVDDDIGMLVKEVLAHINGSRFTRKNKTAI
jgi:hypothetical protein